MAEIRLNGLVFVFHDDDELMEWLDTNADEVHEDAVIKEFDHAMDDIRYMCHTVVRREFDWLDWSVRGGK